MRCVALLALLALGASCRLDHVLPGPVGGPAPVAGPPADLRFVDQPQAARARTTLPPLRVAVHDDQGNVATRFSGPVSLAIDSNPAGGTLGDSTTVAAKNGVATFRHLRIDKAGSGYRLVASAPGTSLAPVKSLPFDILTPLTGDLTVTTTTTGSDLPSGYTIGVDDTIREAIGINATATFIGLGAGSHTVKLSGVPGTCTVSGSNPLAVSVTGGETAQASFVIGCAAPPPSTGTLTVATATSGSNLPSGYTVTLDGDGGQARPIGINDSLTLTAVAAGGHTVALNGVPGNCTVTGANPQTVTVAARSTVRVGFIITCVAPTGTVTATTSTSGSNLPTGYTVTLDGGGQTSAIGINDSLTATGIAAGDHTVALNGVPGNCTVTGANPQTVTVVADSTVHADFIITCVAPTGTLTVTTSTGGSNLPTGYTVTLDGTQTTQIGINDSVTATDIPAGDHTLLLGGIPANCAVGGANPLNVTVSTGATTQTTFAVTCTAPGP